MPDFKNGQRRYSNDEIASAVAAAHLYFDGKRCEKGCRHPVYAKAAEVLGCSTKTVNERFLLRPHTYDVEFQARIFRMLQELANLELPA